MHKLHNFTIRYLVAFLLLPSTIFAQEIASDDFETGNWSNLWNGRTRMILTTENTKNGDYAARFLYPGVASGSDSFSELRFDLGKPYPELSVKFDLYIPANYYHRRDRPANNKFIRLWYDDYGDREKVGASMMAQGTEGESRIFAEHRRYATWGVSQVAPADDFITLEDRGKWISFVVYAKAPTDKSPFEMKIYKNGRLLLEHSWELNYIPGTQGYRYGYLMGWANSGYSEDTFFDLDNVEFHDTDIMSNRVIPNPPNQVTVTQ